jgi:enoyl-CoA hydratase/carnithine racemase
MQINARIEPVRVPATLSPVRYVEWDTERDPNMQLEALLEETDPPDVLVVRFRSSGPGTSLDRPILERWMSSRVVTVADAACPLTGAALEAALCCDLVYLRSTATVDVGPIDQLPSAGLVHALARSGSAAAARALLSDEALDAETVFGIGLAHGVLAPGEPVPIPDPVSLPALTAARDLMRSAAVGDPGRVLELATFRLLFAAGDPIEGATAFLERRQPDFGQPAGGSSEDEGRES